MPIQTQVAKAHKFLLRAAYTAAFQALYSPRHHAGAAVNTLRPNQKAAARPM